MASKVKYFHELPYSPVKRLCQVLDVDKRWEELGGTYMKYDIETLTLIGQAIFSGKSPTSELLKIYSEKNGLLRNLFIWLYRMGHLRAMLVLKPYVDENYQLLCPDENVDCEYLFSSSDGQAITFFSQLQESNALETERIESLEVFPKVPDDKLSNSKKFQQNPEKPFSDYHTQENKERIRRPSLPKTVVQDDNYKFPSDTLPNFTNIPYNEIRQATDNFNENHILGSGGFGVVFKGEWKGISVAIKRLSPKKSNDPRKHFASLKQSLNELNILKCCRFDYILPLYAISLDGEVPCLIYQLMVNGSLEDRLHCKGNTPPLTWSQRSHIAECTAKGLNFLHTTYDKPLVHGDIKSANILLDKNMEPKIGDFGLSKLGPDWNNTHIDVTSVNGTAWYLPCEYLRSKQLSPKVDCYSYGIVMFELATSLRPYDPRRKYNKLLVDHIKAREDSKLLHSLRDCKAGEENMKWFEELIRIGQACTNLDKKKRPFMKEVLGELERIRKRMSTYGIRSLSEVKENLNDGAESISLEKLKFDSPGNLATVAAINIPNLGNVLPHKEEVRIGVQHAKESDPCALSESIQPNENMVVDGTLHYQVLPGIPPVPKLVKLGLHASELPRNPKTAPNMKTSDYCLLSVSKQPNERVINEEVFSYYQEKDVAVPRIPPIPELTELNLCVSEFLRNSEIQNVKTSESCVLSEPKLSEKMTAEEDPSSRETVNAVARVPPIPKIPESCLYQSDVMETSGEYESDTSSSCSSEVDSSV